MQLFTLIISIALFICSYKSNYTLDDFVEVLDTLSVSKVRAEAPGDNKKNKSSRSELTKKPIKASMVLNKREVDPTLFSENDIGILQKLAARRELIDERSEELTLREGLLGAAEKKIDKKILELKRLIIALKKTIKKKKKNNYLGK